MAVAAAGQSGRSPIILLRHAPKREGPKTGHPQKSME